MADVFLSSSPTEAAALLREALEAAGLDVVYAASDSLATDATALSEIVERTPCIIVLWSARAAADPNRAQEVKLALSAWSADRLVLAVLDDSELPAGLRDLRTFHLDADREHATKEIIDRARQLKTAPSRSAPPVESKSRRSVYVMIGIVVMLVLGVIGIGSLYWQVEEQLRPPTAPAPGYVPESAFPPAEETWYAEAWPWGVIGGGALLLSIGLIVVARIRRARKQIPVREAPAAAAAAEPAPQQIFISYSRQDTGPVDRIVEHIEGAGYTVWIDREATGHGAQRFAAPIVGAIRSARVVALMCSRNAFASDHVVREVYVAGDFRKPFLAFQLDQTQFPDELIYFLSGFPRIPADPIEPNQLRQEIKRYVS